MSLGTNNNLNINRSRTDKFVFLLSDIPSSPLLIPPKGDGSIITELDTYTMIFEDVSYFGLSLQSVDMPGVTLNQVSVGTMFSPVSETEMTYTFDTLTTELRIDKDFRIYQLLLLWIYLQKNPEGFNQFGMRETHRRTAVNGTLLMNDVMTGKPIALFDFYDLRPASIPSLNLSYATEDEISLPVTWSYSYWMPRQINGKTIKLKLEDYNEGRYKVGL